MSLAVRFLALFSLVTGVLVLVSAVSSARRQRVREAVLLKTLGATRAQIGADHDGRVRGARRAGERDRDGALGGRARAG